MMCSFLAFRRLHRRNLRNYTSRATGDASVRSRNHHPGSLHSKIQGVRKGLLPASPPAARVAHLILVESHADHDRSVSPQSQ